MLGQTMSRKTMILLVALLGVVILGGAGSFWAYKKIQAKNNKEYRCEAKMVLWDGFEVKTFKAIALSDEILDPVVERNDLVSLWGVSDADAVKTQISKKLRVEVRDSYIHVSYQDRDAKVARQILEGVLTACQKKMNAGRKPLPASK